MVLTPEIDPVTNKAVVIFNYASPSIADVPNETVFRLQMNVVYVSTSKVETITFEISLEYCQSIWGTLPAQPLIELEQITQASQFVFHTFEKVNQATGCSKTRFELKQYDQNDTPIALNENIFELLESEDSTELTLFLKEGIAIEVAGNYSLRYREIHSVNDYDFFESSLKVEIIKLC